MEIPSTILTAAAGLLAPYAASLTPEALKEAIELHNSRTKKKLEQPMTIMQVMELLNINRQTVYRWRKAGKLKSIELTKGKNIRIDPASVRKILTTNQ